MTLTRKWMLLSCFVIIPVVLLLALYFQILQKPNYPAWPIVVMPSPNARDTFSRAEALIKDPDTVEKATTKLNSNPPAEIIAGPPTGLHVFTLAEKDKLVRENLPAIALTRDGLTQKYMNPPSSPKSLILSNLDRSKAPALARLLFLQAQDLEAHSDWNAAMTSTLDGFQFGNKLEWSGPWTAMFLGIRCEAIARKSATDIVGHLTSAQATAAAGRLAKIDADEVPFSQVLVEEKFDQCAEGQFTFENMDWRNLYEPWGYMVSPRHVYDGYSGYMDQEIVNAKLSWPAQMNATNSKTPTDLIARTWARDDLKDGVKLYANLTYNRMLEIALALQAYKLDRHTYPVSLSQLTPTYLPAVPSDPFSNNQPFKYRLNGSTYILYSVGPDGVDNGGTPINSYADSPTLPMDRRYQVFDECQTGDVVYGVNQ